MNQSNILFYGKQYQGTFCWLGKNVFVLEFRFKLEDLDGLLDLDENQVITIRLEGQDKTVTVSEPTLTRDEEGNHAMIECKVVE